MLPQHWVMLAIVAFFFYIVGTKYPQFAMRLGI